MVGITDLAKAASKDAEVSAKKTEAIIRKAFKEIEANVNKGKKVRIAGFGIFSRKKTKARNAKNPRTKQLIKVPSKNKLHFSASSKIKYK
ncbi:MAG: HU family DNA-binding protein [Candidatus Thermoplasmatota archaeon]|jgi:DNA-binding protein HU-beta|nr:HU family DNA-binding protein [Candidatus Thermoplasmatota archaeon]